MLQVITAPELIAPRYPTSLFLAGSIDNGSAVDWQTHVIEALQAKSMTLLNPRRVDWDESWRERQDDPQFHRQVTWELDALEVASHIMIYFAPAGQAPISLLELGLFARSGKVRVVCPEGYWKKGNVDMVCERFAIPVYESLDDLIAIYQSF